MTTNKIQALLSQIPDARVRAELSSAVGELLSAQRFGLVFEEHLPEVHPLQTPPHVGSRVSVAGEPFNRLYLVESIQGKVARIRLEEVASGSAGRAVEVSKLLPVTRFGEAVYPALKPMERVERVEGEPFHTIINADNFHALQLLLWGYENRFDVIYIDPPYNTGARDWKYNNDYVDKSDRFRHSKWLSMMKKRLLLARRLVKQGDGVLVIAIDDNEVHHLGMLLDELFPGYLHHLITTVINPGGTFQTNFARVHEYLYFICPPNLETVVGKEVSTGDTADGDEPKQEIWKLRRTGAQSAHRHQRPKQFYAIYVDPEKLEAVEVGPEIGLTEEFPLEPKGKLVPVYPIDGANIQRVWRYGRDTMADKIKEGAVVAKKSRGSIQLYLRTTAKTEKKLKTVWYEGSHSSVGTAGVVLIDAILGRPNAFSFPKSLYAVKDTLNAIVRDRPDALILDFFAGSGTTLHATLLLNAEDKGKRRCVLVTNNEVSEDEAKALSARKLKPGDDAWEREGICRAVTIPRCKYAINGQRDDGTKLPGKYLTGRDLSQGFDANLQAFSLSFLDPFEIERGGKFEDIAPILWLVAGAQGALDTANPKYFGPQKAWFWPDGAPFIVLLKERHAANCLAALQKLPEAERAAVASLFLVTNSPEAFVEMSGDFAEMLPHARPAMLYKSYLDNFRLGELHSALEISAPSGEVATQ